MPSKDKAIKPSFSECYDVTDACIGKGSQGRILIVICKKTKQEFALKTFRIDSMKQLDHAEAEIQSLTVGLGHESIVQLKDVFRENRNCFYLVLEKLNGGDLQSHFDRIGRLEERNVAKITFALADALRTLHNKDIAHRDLKLENIFCSSDDIFPIKLGDFGLSSAYREPCCRNHGKDLLSDKFGTIEYMAPEIAKIYQDGTGHYTKQCDMWSLGVILFILLSGEFPFLVTRGERCHCLRGFKRRCTDCFPKFLMTIQEGRYRMGMDSIWHTISNEAKHLISNLLRLDPRERYTPDQVLKHPWVKACSQN